MDYELLHSCLFDVLRIWLQPRPGMQLEWSDCLNRVGAKVHEREPGLLPGVSLGHEDALTLRGIVWDLITERVLTPGLPYQGGTNNNWPFFTLTEHGKRVVSEQRSTPYDPSGYLAAIRLNCAGVSDTTVDYVAEAMGCYRANNQLAAAVMIGAASEMMFIELADHLPRTMQSASSVQKATEGMTVGKMGKRVTAVVGWCRTYRSQLPPPWNSDEQAE